MSAATSDVIWRIPPSVLHWQATVPANAPVAVLLRHSVRGELPSGAPGNNVPLTPDGVRLARDLGALLGQRLRSLHTSPVLRCVQTAEAMRGGAGVQLPIDEDHLLGGPGIYVLDGERAWPNWLEHGYTGVIERLIADETMPGMASPDAAARYLVHHMLSVAGSEPGFHVFVTHDALVLPTAARLIEGEVGADAGVHFLEGAFFWRDGEDIHAAYQGARRSCPRSRLCGLTELDVIEFARREIARTVGLRSRARFFLAGGAFKALLTGQAPRDLDLWAPSVEDRALLVATLEERGARRLPQPRHADAFELAGRVIEVPARSEPSTLGERLGRFDLALSAVGVEHLPGDRWSAIINPLVEDCVARRVVLLLKPLVNWRYALATLERLRRYAHELEYTVPDEEEAEVWRAFDSQPTEMQQGMLERFDQTARGGFGVREEAVCRLR